MSREDPKKFENVEDPHKDQSGADQILLIVQLFGKSASAKVLLFKN